MKNRIASCAITLIAFGIVSAAPVFAFHVRSVSNAPGCETPDGSIEVFNNDAEHYYKVKIEGGIGNAAGHTACTGAGTDACVGSFSETVQILSPCGSPNSCKFQNANFPGCQNCDAAGCPNSHSCDNIHTNGCGGGCTATCGTGNAWCSHVEDLRVTILERKGLGKFDTWEDITDFVIAVHGGFGSSPAPEEVSFCTDHTAVRPACSNLPTLPPYDCTYE